MAKTPPQRYLLALDERPLVGCGLLRLTRSRFHPALVRNHRCAILIGMNLDVVYELLEICEVQRDDIRPRLILHSTRFTQETREILRRLLRDGGSQPLLCAIPPTWKRAFDLELPAGVLEVRAERDQFLSTLNGSFDRPCHSSHSRLTNSPIDESL